MAIDKEFSDYSVKHGIAKSFLHYCATDAVLVRDSSMPVKGINAIAQIFDTTKTENYKLSWEPLAADIAGSGEIGYTYGTSRLVSNDSVPQKLYEGCYVTIWKKDSEGNWKWALDVGTSGLSKK
jgi:ketosteroid isomerase-like protein